MLAICTDNQEAEITGSAEDLRNIRTSIVRLLSSGEASVSCVAVPCDPAPYSRSLAQIVIQRASGPTLVTVTQSTLLVAGSDDSLARFSSWFNLPSDVQSGYHAHFEPLPGDPYHSPESVSLVVGVSRAGA